MWKSTDIGLSVPPFIIATILLKTKKSKKMEKTNLIKTDAQYYKASKQPRLLELEDKNYISLKGNGAPESERFMNSIKALYPVAYDIKRQYQKKNQDFVVPKMEAFWWVEGEKPFDETAREDWYWEVLIRLPDFVEKEAVESSVQSVVSKKGNPLVSEIYFKKIPAHKCVQMLHLGSYEDEKPTIDKMFKFMQENGLEINGYHREIYITDPMKTSVEKLKTILRYAVK